MKKECKKSPKKSEERLEIEVVMMILSDCTEEQLKKIDEYDAFLRMATNFVKFNTKEDIKLFVKHNTIFKILNSL